MDHSGTFWGTLPMQSFQPEANLPPIPEVDYDAAWCPTEPGASDHFLPLSPYVSASHHTANPNWEAQEIANLAGQVRQLQTDVLEMREKSQASLSEMIELINRWSLDTEKTLVQMIKDVANLDRNYLKLIPWCYQVHEKVSECIAEKETTQIGSGVKK